MYIFMNYGDQYYILMMGLLPAFTDTLSRQQKHPHEVGWSHDAPIQKTSKNHIVNYIYQYDGISWNAYCICLAAVHTGRTSASRDVRALKPGCRPARAHGNRVFTAPLRSGSYEQLSVLSTRTIRPCNTLPGMGALLSVPSWCPWTNGIPYASSSLRWRPHRCIGFFVCGLSVWVALIRLFSNEINKIKWEGHYGCELSSFCCFFGRIIFPEILPTNWKSDDVPPLMSLMWNLWIWVSIFAFLKLS